MLDRLTDEQKAELEKRYLAGESAYDLGRDASVGYTGGMISLYLKSRGISRNYADSARLAKTCTISEITAEKLHELYWGEGRLSIAAIARKYGVAKATVRKYLIRFGIPVRDLGSQVEIEYRKGRHGINREAHARIGAVTGKLNGGKNGTKQMLTPKARAKVAAKLRRRIKVACFWCGLPLERVPSRLHHRAFCNNSEGTTHQCFVRKHGENAPRPLIVEKLVQLADMKYRMLRERNPDLTLRPNSYEQLEKFGAEIGAWEPEILAVLERQGAF